MREIPIGEKKVRIRATPMALVFYEQAFNRGLEGDIIKMQNLANDLSEMNTVQMLRMAWAMAKADAFGHGSFPPFMEWVSQFESVDVSEVDFFVGILEEAADGFFRSGIKGAIQK